MKFRKISIKLWNFNATREFYTEFGGKSSILQPEQLLNFATKAATPQTAALLDLQDEVTRKWESCNFEVQLRIVNR